MGETDEYTLATSSMQVPKDDEINLVLVQTPANTLHWIAQSSDNTYFDSLRNFQPGGQFGCIGSAWSSRPYIDTGVWVTVKNHNYKNNKDVIKLDTASLFAFD